MKKFNIRFAAVPMLMLGMLLAAGCDKETENEETDEVGTGKRLVKVTQVSFEEPWRDGQRLSDGGEGYFYDYTWSGNKLSGITNSKQSYVHTTLNYTGNKITSINVDSDYGEHHVITLNYQGDLLTGLIYGSTTITYEYDSDGHLVKSTKINNNDDNPHPRVLTYSWTNDNLTGFSKEYDDGIHTTYYEYDTKSNAFTSFPHAAIIVLGEMGFNICSLSKNNPVSERWDTSEHSEEYGTYEYSGDYPISLTTKRSAETGFEEYGYDSVVFYKATYYEYDDGTGRR